MEVVVKLAPDAAEGLARSCVSPHAYLDKVAARFQTALEPAFEGATDPELASYYSAAVSNEASEAMVAELRTLRYVEAAYTKPAATPPTTAGAG